MLNDVGFANLEDQVRFQPVSLFTSPLDLPNLYSWHDASDSDTITTSGSNVTLWEDKSTNGIDLTVTATGPTLATADQNGLDAVVFSGAAGGIRNATAWDGKGTTDITVAILCRPTTIDSSSDGVVHVGDYGFNGNVHISFRTDLTNNMRVYSTSNGSADAQVINPSASISAGDPLSVIYTRTAGSGGALISGVTGTEDRDPTSQITIGGNTGDGYFAVGFYYSTGNAFAGKIYEVITCDGVMSEADQASLRTYWQNKWGIS
jgi:hypothetical protein